ncbi:MAG: ParB/RepB/Spo0J family partition protein [Alphaproteobacteria bacterium]
MKKRGLGQGLSALLGEEISSSINRNEGGTKEVFSTQLSPSSFQPREIFDNDELDLLAASIRNNGILQPILVRRKSDNDYEIIAGERRWRAAQRVGLEKIPVIEKILTDEEALTIALVENIQRENLNPIEEAHAYQRIIEKTGYTQEKVSEIVGKSRAHVANLLRLNQLSDKAKTHVKDGKISMGHAKVLIGMENIEEIIDLIIQKNLNVRQTENLVKKLKILGNEKIEKKSPSSSKKQKENLMTALLYTDDEVLKVQGFIEEIMQCKTTVQIKGENNITVSFHLKGMDELDSFMAKINTTFSE